MLERLLARCRTAPIHRPEGVVLDVVGLIVEVGGLRAAVGDALAIHDPFGSRLEVEVVGFRAGRLLTTPLGPLSGVRPGARVLRLERGATVPCSFGMLGRVVDSFGRPLDGGPEIVSERACPVNASPPPAFARRPIEHSFATGVRAFDALLPLGVGQRMGIFAGAGVGKSTLLGMICRSSQADVNVVGLIGERGRELNDFIRNSLGPDGLAKSVVVAATSDMPPLVRARGAESATAIAEYFRSQGKSVLLVMDSVTRYAMALREAALAAGEPPATKGYPPSVFAALPRLLERAGTSSGQGVITALYTVLVEGDDLSDPIADAVRSILDGHVVLSRSLAERGHFPAIDVLASISRLAPEIAPEATLRAAGAVRDMMSAHREAKDLIQVGAYAAGSDPRVDTAIAALPQIDAFLQQRVNEATRIEESRTRLAMLAQLRERVKR
ncbi:MAG TPA: FliI/YscN family ATPase [Polyangiaceae bacterium]|jgi:flagellum-specific ATP synthase|nr:FliI/YscN family ATPase [Polyangiaceae bacterium]